MKIRRAHVLLVAMASLFLAVAVALTAVEIRSRRTFAAPYPALAASTDPAVVARGRYLVFGPAACAYCHVPRDQWRALDRLKPDQTMPLSGNHLFRLPLGDLYSANLTTDGETGIGRRSDAELARILRFGVRADARAAFPLMSYQEMADDDVTAVISFLRSQGAVRLEVPGHSLNLLGKTLMAFAIEPAGPAAPPAAHAPEGLSVARGEYLATRVSSCVECHTDRDPRSGAFVGPKFGGGQRMDLAASRTQVAVPPNLTPDPKTSPIGSWTEEVFLARFRAGELIEGTPMPWGAFARMTDDDLRSIYRYLRTLPPYEHATGPAMQDRR
jgi:mono/diheme cytochrome c family protein